jgi:transcriptional regulator with XRE-family HTH domain
MTFDEVSKRLGRNVKSIRIKAGLSVSELSKKAHIDRGTIVDIEIGTANPLFGSLFKIAKALNIQLLKLCEGI